LAPVSARFFPFLSDKTILPSEYSEREDQINAYNEQAIELFEAGHFKEAQELWEKAIQVMERSGSHFTEYKEAEEAYDLFDEEMINIQSEDTSNNSEEEDLYQMGVSFFKKQKYIASKKTFDRLEAIIPDYKATRNYLTILKHKIKQKQQTLSGDRFQDGALYRQRERDEWKRILEESERELKKKLVEQVSPLYKEALEHYKSRKFTLAKDYFKEIDNILPKYKDTSEYLLRIDTDIRQEEQRFVKENYKKEVLKRKKEQEEWKRIMEESERKLQEKIKEQVEPIYQEALHFYKQRKFDIAKSRFQEVKRIFPDYRSTAKYIERIDQDVQNEAKRRELIRLRENEQKKKNAQIARKREEERLARLRAVEEKNRTHQFQREVASRRKEREEWLQILKESEAERQRKWREQADFIYHEAVQFYKRRQFEQAREDFLEVEQVIADYKSTAKYLARIDRDIEEEEKVRFAQQQRMYKREIRENQLAELEEIEEEKQFRALEDAKRLREFKVKARLRREQRDQWDRVLRNNEREREKRLNKEADYIYEEALHAYKKKHWERARSTFLEVEQVIAGYKKTNKYLARIDNDIEDERQRIKIAEQKSIEQQRKKEALVRQREEDRQRKILEADKKRQLKQQQKQAEAVYKFATSLFQRGDYTQAKTKFLEVEQILPGYKSAARYFPLIHSLLLSESYFFFLFNIPVYSC